MTTRYSPQIFYVWNFLEWGGGQIYLLAIMKEAKPDWRIKVVLPVGSSEQILRFIEAVGVEYELIDAHLDLNPAKTLKRKLERHYRKLKCEYKTLAYLAKQKYDVLHIDMTPWQSFLAMLYLLARSSVFVTLHNRQPEIARWRYFSWKAKLAVLTRISRFNLFASNQDTKDSLKGLVPENFRQRIKVTYTAVDEKEIIAIKQNSINREELLRRCNLPIDKFLVFCVGQFIDRKGRWLFLEAAEKVGRERADVHFVWITNSQINSSDCQKILEYKVEKNFQLLEANLFVKERQQLLTLINLADLFALPSYVEGLPIALLEAMALAVPSISTEVNAIPEAIKHLDIGWLIKTGNSAALAEAVVTLLDDENLRRKLARNGSELVLNRFTEKVSAQTALAEYAANLREINGQS